MSNFSLESKSQFIAEEWLKKKKNYQMFIVKMLYPSWRITKKL